MEEKVQDANLAAQPPKKKRGAPPGNHNALTHGFYSRVYNRYTRTDLDGHEFNGLADEITLLRVFIRQTIELAGKPSSIGEALDTLRGISLGFFSLARLVRTHHIICGADNPLRDALHEALDRVRHDLGIALPKKDASV